MNKLRTMSLNFRVWDKWEEKLYDNLNFWQVAHILSPEVRGKEKANTDEGRFIISQDTGFKVGGTNIYTGDILLLDNGKRDVYGEIIYDEGSIVLDYHDGESLIDLLETVLKMYEAHVQIVGNIWENPELLKGVSTK